MRRTAWLALLILVPFAVEGCAGAAIALPAAAIAYKGASKATEAARPITDSEEYYIGRAVAARVLGKYKLDQNPKLTEYVNEVGQTVARKSSRPNPFRGYHWTLPKSTPLPVPGGLSSSPRG
jgi:predicted Zn-dependent protease